MVLHDGHVHTPFCPHGSIDDFRAYIERAIQIGYKGLTFTEHAPLPEGFTDPTPFEDSGMDIGKLDAYFRSIENLQKEYRNEISIHKGLEVDFIDGFETETKHFLDEYGPELDDAILSVHFLKTRKGYSCMDYSPDVFGSLIEEFGSVQEVYYQYFKTVQKSIQTDLGGFKPKRIGHISLVMKFKEKYPNPELNQQEILHTLDLIAKSHLALDYNGSGVMKPLCRAPYPPDWIIAEAINRNIPLVYGSDAHRAKELGQGFAELMKEAPLTQPF